MTHMRLNRLGARWILLSASGLSLILAATVRLPADTRVESQSHLLKDIKYLASDELEGRGIGTDGLNKAADYIREQFKDAGLDVTRVNGDAFQKFKMTTKAILGSPNSRQVRRPRRQSHRAEAETSTSSRARSAAAESLAATSSSPATVSTIPTTKTSKAST